MRKSILVLAISILLFSSLQAHALYYTFSGEAAGGIGSGTMDVTVSGNTLTIKINNTSPYKTVDNLSANAPALDGIGFDLVGVMTSDLTSWSLTAFSNKANTTLVYLGGIGSIGAWNFGNIPGETFDIELTNGSGIQNALYNPKVVWGTGPGPYYTEATLTMTFDQDIVAFKNPFMRMQNVGKDGEGSLKLPGDPGGGTPVPEAATLLLLGIGLIGVAVLLRERR